MSWSQTRAMIAMSHGATYADKAFLSGLTAKLDDQGVVGFKPGAHATQVGKKRTGGACSDAKTKQQKETDRGMRLALVAMSLRNRRAVKRFVTRPRHDRIDDKEDLVDPPATRHLFAGMIRSCAIVAERPSPLKLFLSLMHPPR